MNTHDKLWLELSDNLDNWTNMNDTTSKTLEYISSAVEKAYAQGMADLKNRHTHTEPEPAWIRGFDLTNLSSQQIGTIASLYAKEQGFKP